MSFEIEKKYRLTTTERERVLAKLQTTGARFEAEDFETNTLYRGGILSLKPAVLRLRETARKTVLTYKEALPSESDIKRRIEHETEIADAEKMRQILQSLGFTPALVYEKRRQIWRYETVEIAVDELPFGLFLEIEAAEAAIRKAEKTLETTDLIVEPKPYPTLAAEFGTPKNEIIEARFG